MEKNTGRSGEHSSSLGGDLTADQVQQLREFVASGEMRIQLAADGAIILVRSDGQQMELPQALARLITSDPDKFEIIAQLEANPHLLIDGLGGTAAEGKFEAWVENLLATAPAPIASMERGGETIPGGRPISFETGGAVGDTSGPGVGAALSTLNGTGKETRRFGRGDLKRGEAGSAGQEVDTLTGPGMSHLTGLADEETGHRNGEKQSSSDNVTFSGNPSGVGIGVDHLWLLGDTDYIRASSDLVGDDIYPRNDDGDIAYPTLTPDVYSLCTHEETSFSGMLFSASDAILPVTDLSSSIDPSIGTFQFGTDGSYVFVPGANFSGSAVAEITYTDPRNGVPSSGTINIKVVSITDVPEVATGGTYVTDEDTPVVLSGLVSDLVDDDLSETLRVEISGVPTGGTFDRGTEVRPGVWAFSPSDIASGVSFTPPADLHGDFPMTLTATATESATGLSESASAPFVVTVNPVVDPLTLTPASVSVNEDASVNVGAGVFIKVGDPDGSEVLTELTVSDVPAGAGVTYTAAPGAAVSVVIDPGTGIGSYTITGSETAIRTTLQSFVLQPPLHVDDNITLTVSATVTDGTATNTTSAPLAVTVSAVADAPTITGSASGSEDAPIALPVQVALTDTDGSESFDYVDVTVPTGVALTHTTPPHGIVATAITGGYRYEPGATTSTAQFQAFLATGLSVQQANDSDTDFLVSVTAGTIESTPVGGEVSVLRASTSSTIAVAVAPVIDLPTVSGSSSVDEDGTVNFGSAITITSNDTDGSEHVTAVEISNFPTGVTPTYTAVGGATVSLAAGTYTVSGGTDADIRATVASFSLDLSQPNYNDLDGDISLAVAVTTTDSDTETAASVSGTTPAVTHTIVVNAVADTPSVTGDTETTNEDTRVHLDDLAGSLNDATNETLTFEIRGVNAAASLENGAGTGYGFVTETDGTRTYSIPVASIADVYFDPPADADGTYNMSIAAIATEVGAAGEPTADDVAQSTAPVVVTVTPDVDAPAITGSSSVDEDTQVNLGANVTISAPDSTDGSEAITSIVLGNLPAGSILRYDDVDGTSITVTVPAGGGSITLDGGTEAQIRTALATVMLTPPPHSDQNIAVSIAVTKNDNGVVATTNATHNVTVSAVADAPSISGSASGSEDTPISVPVTASLTDTDGTETYDYADVTVPSGVSLTHVALPNGITAATITGGFRFTPGAATTTAQFEAFLATGLTVQQATDSDVDFNVAVTIGTIESALTDGEVTTLRNSATANIPVSVAPVVDLPTVSGSSLVDEDGTTNFGANISISSNDTDGSEAITSLAIGNFPTGVTPTYTLVGGATVTASGGVYTISGGSEADIRATLATFTLDLSQVNYADLDGDLALSVSVTKTDNDTETAAVATATTSAVTHNIVVNAVADTPSVTGDTETTNEDTRVHLDSLSGALNDATNETLTFEISSVPGDAVLENSAGVEYAFTTQGDGTKTYTIPTASIGNVYFDPPADEHGTFNMTITATATEAGAAGEATSDDVATATAPISVTVAPVVDAPTISGSSTVNEDNAVNIGASILISAPDSTDGSEKITGITLGALPAGTVVQYNDVDGSSQSVTIPAGGGSITLDGGTEAQIRTALASVTVTPPPHSDENIAVTVAVTKDDNGVTATTNGTYVIAVSAVADAPTVSGAASGTEDQPITIPVTSSLVDTDGSETYEFADVTVPTGVALSHVTLPNGITATAIAGGLRFAPGASTTTAQFEAFLATGIRAQQATDSDVDFDVSVTVGTIESTLSGGEIATLRASTTATIAVTVAPAIDLPTISGSSLVDEDGTIAFGGNITISSNDTDGSEVISSIAVGNFPTDVVPTYALTGGATISFAGGVYTISGGSEADIRATLASFTLDLSQVDYADLDADIALSVAVTKKDNDTETSGVVTGTTPAATHTIVVNAVADIPSVTGDTETTNEDTRVLLDDLGGSLNDPNNETLTFQIRGVDGGAKLENAAGVEYSFTTGAGGVKTYSIAAADIDEVYFLPPLHEHGAFNMTVAAIATEAGAVGEATSDDVAEATAPIVVNVTGVVDSPVIGGSGSSVTNEDTQFSLGSNLNLTVADTDGSQTLKVTLTGIPDPAGNAAPTYTANPNVTVDDTGGVYEFDGPVADVLAVLNSFQITPPTDSDVNFTVGVAAVTTETSTGATASLSADHVVTVNAVADAPSVSITGSGNEDTFIGAPVVVSLNDTDGTETLQSVVVSGFPTETGGTGTASATPGAQIRIVNGAGTQTLDGNFSGTVSGTDGSGNAYTIVGDGSGGLTFTGTTTGIINALASIEVKRGDHVGDDFDITATATSVESNPTTSAVVGDPNNPGGEITTATATTIVTQTIDVMPITDPIVAVAPTSIDMEEDALLQLASSGFGHTQTDADGSETVTYLVGSLPTGAAIVDGSGNPIGTSSGSGVTLTAAQFANARFRPPQHEYGDYALTFTAITDESSGTSTPQQDTANVTIRVAPDPDAPTVSGSTNVIEDTTANFGSDVSYALVDADGSEEIVKVEIGNIPAGWTVSHVGGMPSNVTFDGSTYTIVAAAGATTQAARQQSIRDAVNTFQITPPANSDDNASVTIAVTTQDDDDTIFANGNEATTTVTHDLTTYAVADAPTVTAGFTVNGDENDDILLLGGGQSIVVNRSVDTDGVADSAGFGSENLSVRISGIPTGASVSSASSLGTIAASGPDAIVVTADNEDDLNAFLNTLTFQGGNFAGTVTLTVTATTTETGPEINTPTADDVDTITININPVVDTPIVSGNATGQEDSRIDLPIGVKLTDLDGSETYVLRIADVPAGATLYGAGGTALTPDGSGIYTLSAADEAALQIQAPEDYSSALSGPLTINAYVDVTDTVSTGTAMATTGPIAIPINVIGVADTPVVQPVNIVVDEDQPITIGQGIIDSLAQSGDTDAEALNRALDDTDGSERLTFVLSGLPVGVIPSAGTFIGAGTFQIDAADIPGLTIPSPPNFSGNYISATGITLSAVSQETDGDDASITVPLSITINPVINNGATEVDGFTSWTPNVTVTEDNDISLADITDHTLADTDGSEQVLSYTYDFNSIIADAQIGSIVPDAATFISNHVNGTYTNNGDGTITVLSANAGGISLSAAAFHNSNVDFNIPVSALLEDTVGGPTTTETTSFSVNLVGDADIPTVSVAAAAGTGGTPIALTLGGDTTDNDVAQGRTQSEEIYYILRHTNAAASPRFALVNSSGQVVGVNNGDGTYLLTQADLADINLLAPNSGNGVIDLELTTVAVENDGDLATNNTGASFTVTVSPSGAPDDNTPPLTPELVIGTNETGEDASHVLNVSVAPGAGDTTNPSVVLIISDLPAGTEISGAVLNPVTGKYVATGPVTITPPDDFSGELPITVEAIATNANQQSTSTGPQVTNITVDPVADGVNINASPSAGVEDTPVDLNISLSSRDATDQLPADANGDTPEIIEDTVFVQVSAGTLSQGTLLTSGPYSGFYQMTQAELALLQLTPPADSTDAITVTVAATSTETDDDADGDNTATTTSSFTVSISADADLPTVTVPATVLSGSEDSAISIPGLSVTSADSDGSELISAKITGVPDGTLFNVGANNGDGTWTIPLASLATLTVTPPANFSGTLEFGLVGLALEPSNGDFAETTPQLFSIEVAPVADEVLLVAESVDTGTDGAADLDLNVRLDDTTGSATGENASEKVELTFSSVPAGVTLVSRDGGAIEQVDATTWRFTGSQDQANALTMSAGPDAQTGFSYFIDVSAVTIDNGVRNGSAESDSFKISLDAPSAASQTLIGDSGHNLINGGSGHDQITGLAGADHLAGGAGNDRLNGGVDSDHLYGQAGHDYLVGGPGQDTMIGGSGGDTFAWLVGDVDGLLDTITDFDPSEGDVLDISAVLVGFDPLSSVLSEFVQASVSPGITTIAVDVDGGGDNFVALVSLQSATGFNLEDLHANGNLIT